MSKEVFSILHTLDYEPLTKSVMNMFIDFSQRKRSRWHDNHFMNIIKAHDCASNIETASGKIFVINHVKDINCRDHRNILKRNGYQPANIRHLMYLLNSANALTATTAIKNIGYDGIIVAGSIYSPRQKALIDINYPSALDINHIDYWDLYLPIANVINCVDISQPERDLAFTVISDVQKTLSPKCFLAFRS